MCLENAFQISEVVRPSLHEELIKGEVQAAAVAVPEFLWPQPLRHRPSSGFSEKVQYKKCPPGAVMKPWAMLGLAESDGFYWSLLVHESTMTDMTGKSAGIVSNLLGAS